MEHRLGAIRDSFEQYLSRKDCLSSSDIGNLLDSPLAYQFAQSEPKEDKPHFTLGSALHCVVIEPSEFMKRYQTFDISLRPEQEKGMTSKINKEWKAEMIAAGRENGIEYLTDKQQEEIQLMKNSVERNPEAMRLMGECTMFETSYYAQVAIEDRKYNLRCRPDMMGHKHYVSVKSTKNPTPELFYKDSANYDYQAKEAFYWLVLNATRRAMGMPELENGYVVAIGTMETFVYELNMEALRVDGLSQYLSDGVHLVDVALKRYDKLKSTGRAAGSEINYGGKQLLPMQTPQWKQNKIDSLILQNQ